MRVVFIGLGAILPWLCSCSPEGGAETSANLTDQLAQGKFLYEQSCAQCHYDGEGSSTAPDLRGSAVLAQPPQDLARLILTGRQGVSLRNGQKFDAMMLPQAYLSDEEIAAIVVFVRQEFAQHQEAFSAHAVAEIRADLGK